MSMVGLGWRHPHYAQVLAQRPHLAFLEVHSENFFAAGGAVAEVLQRGREAYPISLHGVGLSLGSAAGVDPWHLDQLAQLVARIDPVRVSDHASFARGPLTGAGLVHAADLLPVPWTDEALRVMADNVQRVQDRLRRPIAVENISAYLQWAQADWTEPAFLAELSRRTGCQLLLDVNNLVVNARNRHLAQPTLPPDALVAECCAWVDALKDALGQTPPTPEYGHHPAIAEIHLAGHTHAGDIVIDDHGSRVSDPVWAVFVHAQATLGAVPSLIEWDTDIPDLGVLLDEAQRAQTLATQTLAVRTLAAPTQLGNPRAHA
jgi:uncharacterized protein (UPF0276 family)